MAAPRCAGREDSCKVQDLAVEGFQETYQEMVLGGCHSYDSVF